MVAVEKRIALLGFVQEVESALKELTIPAIGGSQFLLRRFGPEDVGLRRNDLFDDVFNKFNGTQIFLGEFDLRFPDNQVIHNNQIEIIINIISKSLKPDDDALIQNLRLMLTERDNAGLYFVFYGNPKVLDSSIT